MYNSELYEPFFTNFVKENLFKDNFVKSDREMTQTIVSKCQDLSNCQTVSSTRVT